MPLVCHEDVKDFYRVAVPLLTPQEAYNNLPLGLLLLLQRRPELIEKALMLSIQRAESALVGLQLRPELLVIGQTLGAQSLIPELAGWLRQHRPNLQNLAAPKALAESFAAAWQAQGGRCPKVQLEQGVYRLEQVRPQPRPEGHYRLAELRDLNQLLDWIEAFIIEALPHERANRDGIRAATLRQLEAQDIGLWELGDHPVSMAARTRPTLKGIAISLVYTPPEQRGKGYAAACTAALSQAQIEAGMSFCCLFTDLANPTSNRIYQRIGYEPVGDVLVLDFAEARA